MHLKEHINCMEEAVNTLNGLLIELQFHLCFVSIILYLPKRIPSFQFLNIYFYLRFMNKYKIVFLFSRKDKRNVDSYKNGRSIRFLANGRG